MIRSYSDVFDAIRANCTRKKMVVAWGIDNHTIAAASQAMDLGIVDAILVGDRQQIETACSEEGIDSSKFEIVDEAVETKAVALAVKMVHDGQGDVLMKGLCSTDKFLKAILDKQNGILPPKGLLCHIGVMESPAYHKLLFLTDNAVIPLPDLKQKQLITSYAVKLAKSFGVETPKVAFIAATEQILQAQPATVEAAALTLMAQKGMLPGCIADGPLAIDVAIDKESAEIKKLNSPVAGDADVLIFPNLEASNIFWKVNSKMAQGVKLGGMLAGTTAPCILASRADSIETKLNSIAEAVMAVL